MPNQPQTSERKLCDRVMDAWTGHEPAYCMELAREFTRDYPENFAVWIVLADVLVDLARYDEARAALRKAERYCPEGRQARVWVNLGHLYKEKGNYPRSEHWYRRAVNAKPTTNRLIYLGSVLAKKGSFAEAKRCHRRAVRLATRAPDEAHYNLGLIFRAERRYENAIKHLDAALKIDPKYDLAKKARKDCVRALKSKGLSRRSVSQTPNLSRPSQRKLWRRLMDAWPGDERAYFMELAREYTRSYPENGAGWFVLADQLGRFARYDEARAALRKAGRYCPEEHPAYAWVQIGHLYEGKQDYPRAELWYRRAANADPTTRTLTYLGAVLAERERIAEAKRCHRKAIRLATTPPHEAHYNLGLTFRAERRYEGAIEHLDAALEFDPRYELARKARKDCERALKARGRSK